MRPAAFVVEAGPVVPTSKNYIYTRSFHIEVTDYNVAEVSEGGITYQLLSIPGGDMAIACTRSRFW